VKVLFVYSDISGTERYGAKKYYTGLGMLSAVLRDAGHTTELLYLQSELAPGEFVADVERHQPDLVAFSSTTHQYAHIEGYAVALKKAHPELVTLCGGVHVTLVPNEVVTSSGFDLICVGEGEYPLLDLVKRLEAGQDILDIPNLWGVRDGKVIRNPLRPLTKDLDELPYGDRELFGYEEILQANDGWVDLMSGRGCPYNCTFCCNHALKQTYQGLGPYVRFRSVAHVIGEIRQLRARYPIKTLNFQDDIFTMNAKWTKAFCAAYAQEFDYPFWINSRVERMQDEEMVRALAEAGCVGIRIGVENGVEELRDTVLGRTMSNEQIIAAVHMAQRYGLKVFTTNMIGIPGETAESIAATIDLNRQIAPDEYQFSVFYPYPLTQLGESCVAQGLMRSDQEMDSYFGRRSALQLPTLSDAELEQGYDRFQALADELALRRTSPQRYGFYKWLLNLYHMDSPRLHRHLGRLRTLRRRLLSLIKKGS